MSERNKKRRILKKDAPFLYCGSRAEQNVCRPGRKTHINQAAGKKNPGLAPGKRYAVQRIGAFGRAAPRKVTRHCPALLLSIPPASLAPGQLVVET
ncbi:hypothetical protein [Paraburkholderia sp. SIMBA_030]|uniref:hypothetical protein n=1 Tax=Paraburkholderia sp. SIMBA_030 TaxID=3085773 RepID=UPI0039796B32